MVTECRDVGEKVVQRRSSILPGDGAVGGTWDPGKWDGPAHGTFIVLSQEHFNLDPSFLVVAV